MSRDRIHLQEVIFEVLPRGNHLRVTACDPITGIEASVLVPQTQSQNLHWPKMVAKGKLERLITAKLERQLGRKYGRQDDNLY